MNDGDYPRTRMPMDFDLMALDYRPGDRSRREDDRYLFLEALLSARDGLHISWVGRSIHDNSVRPPSVLVGQLRDHLAAGWTLAGHTGPAGKAGEALLAALTVEHRLQPFSPDYFPAFPAAARLFTYAQEWQPKTGAADAGAPETDSVLPLLLRAEPLSLRDLGDFLRQPVRAFFRQRLGVSFEIDDPASDDQEPFEVDGLGRWQLQDELIRAQVAALEQAQDLAAARNDRLAGIRRRGDLPGGAFGDALADELLAPLDDFLARYQRALARWPSPVAGEQEIRFQVSSQGQELAIADWLGGLRSDGAGRRGRVVLETRDLVRNHQYRGEKVIHHWVEHLALHLAGGPLSTDIVSKVGDVTLPPLTIEQACCHLEKLLLAWQQGMQRPLPLAARTAFAYLRGGDDAARKTYQSAYQSLGEVDSDVYLKRAYPDFDALSANGDFHALAETLLRPLFEAIPASREKAGGAEKSTGVSA
jgi:exodeoxyribonuclease V gamma subunit